MGNTVDVIIPVKNALHWVLKSIDELFVTSTNDFRQLIVVDDGSTPENFRILSAHVAGRSRIQLVRNSGRPGYGGACNFGVAQSDADVFAFLNSDCLLTPGAIKKMAGFLERDPWIGMICPLSNNSPVLTVQMRPGMNYRQMNASLEAAFSGADDSDIAIDACTVVGTCLVVTRTCWKTVGEFSPIWELGYGEETDLQFRAMKLGFRGVVALNTYVYHFGGGSFTDAKHDELRVRNHRKFMEIWGADYARYAQKCAARNPVTVAN